MGRTKVDPETREEIILMLGEGKAPKEIAEELGFPDSRYVRGLKHDLKRTNDVNNDIQRVGNVEMIEETGKNGEKQQEVIRSDLPTGNETFDLKLDEMVWNEKQDKNGLNDANNVFQQLKEQPKNVSNHEEAVKTEPTNVLNTPNVTKSENHKTLIASILLGVIIACLKWNGIDEIKLVLEQFSVAKNSIGVVSFVLVAAPLVLLLQPQNEKTHYYSVAIFVIVCLLQVFCSAMSISQALETPFETAIKNTIHIEKNTFTYFMSPIRPLLELLMELVLLGNLKQRSA